MLLHFGAGLYHQNFVDNSPELTFNDQSQFGLSGNLVNRNFPIVTGIWPALRYNAGTAASPCQATGGLQELGPYAGQGPSYEMRPTGTTSLTYVQGKHTYKVGAEWDYEQAYSKPHPLVTLTTGTAATSDPFTNVNSYGAFSPGFGFASFLLGDLASTGQGLPSDTREATMDWALYIQDSWKITRKLTVDYGIRWDYDTPEKEQYGRLGNFDATGINTNAGGHPGNYQYAQTCGCAFYKSAYPFAHRPALGHRVSDRSQDGVPRRLGGELPVRRECGRHHHRHCRSARISSAYSDAASASFPPANQFVNISTPGAVVAPNWPM